MDIFSALRSLGLRHSKSDLRNGYNGGGDSDSECSSKLLVKNGNSSFASALSPRARFTRFGSTRARARGSNNHRKSLTPHRENKLTSSASMPNSRASSVFGDSDFDLFSGNKNPDFCPENYLDPNQGNR